MWKAFAKQQEKWFEEVPVVFQNLKFLRPTVLNSEGTYKSQNNYLSIKFKFSFWYVGSVKFNINILNGSGDFELLEGGSLTVSGNIRLFTENIVENQIEHLSIISEKMEIYPDDFYKELRLRGYQYKDEFLGFVEANSDGEFWNLYWPRNKLN